MVFYYEQKDPIFYAVLVFARTSTIFGLVSRRPEFWIFLAGHCVSMGMFRTGMWDPGDLTVLRWEAVNAMLLFMVFVLTFYNGHCYQRYMYLYNLCMEVLDGTCFFVQEIIISMSPPSVERHRVRAVKYILAMLHIFFIGLTGRMKKKADWRELVQRGLLTALEAEQLQNYPAQSIETVLVLSTWAMQTVDRGLEDDAFWGARSMRIAHTHNRLQGYMSLVLGAIHEIGDTMAMPIPFAYYHVMNVVLIFDMMMLCVLTASFMTYQTVFPFLVSVLFFLGLREVAGSLSDPFGGDVADFPINSFLRYAFDSAVCLLEAFRHGDAVEFTRNLVQSTEEFTSDQMRHIIANASLYSDGYDPLETMPFSWNREMPLTEMTGDPDGPELVLDRTKMFPDGDWKNQEIVAMTRAAVVEEYVEEVKKLSLLAKCCGMCCGKRKVVIYMADEHVEEVDIHAKANRHLLAEKEENTHIEEEIRQVKKDVALLKQKLEWRLHTGRELGLHVDAMVAKALDKTKSAVDAHHKHRPQAPEFTTFSEAQIIVANATAPV